MTQVLIFSEKTFLTKGQIKLVKAFVIFNYVDEISLHKRSPKQLEVKNTEKNIEKVEK